MDDWQHEIMIQELADEERLLEVENLENEIIELQEKLAEMEAAKCLRENKLEELNDASVERAIKRHKPIKHFIRACLVQGMSGVAVKTETMNEFGIGKTLYYDLKKEVKEDIRHLN